MVLLALSGCKTLDVSRNLTTTRIEPELCHMVRPKVMQLAAEAALAEVETASASGVLISESGKSGLYLTHHVLRSSRREKIGLKY